jgi:hypothetical protein
LDLPPASLVGITGKRKKLLTCTQEITRAKLERLSSARHIHGGQKTTSRYAMALSKAKGVISLLAHCQTPFQERGNEASIRVPKMFKSHV